MLLSVGLVLFTTFVVGFVLQAALPALPLAAAINDQIMREVERELDLEELRLESEA